MTRAATGGVALALALLAAPAVGHARVQAPPPPASLDGAGVRAWLDRYIEDDGWTVLAADQGAVALSKPAGVSTLADATLQAEIRHEFFRPAQFGAMRSRSNLQVWNLDCERSRMRVLAIRIYEGNNLQGAHEERENLQAPWTPLQPGSAPAQAAERLCTGKRESVGAHSGTSR